MGLGEGGQQSTTPDIGSRDAMRLGWGDAVARALL